MAPAEIARALGDADAERRRRAVVAMSGRSEPALAPLLLRALGDQDWRVREEAIRVGRDLAPRVGMISALLAALDQGDNVGLRNAALALLKLLGGAAIGPLTAALPDLPAGTRKLVIEVLAQRGDTQVLKMLSEAADAADLNLATAAIEGLAAVGGAQAEAVLRGKLKKSSPFLRIAALDALDKLAAVVPWEELEPLLSDRMALRVAVRALGRSGRREAIPALLGALGDRSEAVAGSAALALACLAQNDALRAPLHQQLASVTDGVRARLRALAAQPGEVGVAANVLLAPQRAPEPGVTRKAASAMLDPRSADTRAALFAKGPRLELEEFRAIAELIRRVSGIKLTDELRPTIRAPAQRAPERARDDELRRLPASVARGRTRRG